MIYRSFYAPIIIILSEYRKEDEQTSYHRYLVQRPKGRRSNFRYHYLTDFFFPYRFINKIKGEIAIIVFDNIFILIKYSHVFVRYCRPRVFFYNVNYIIKLYNYTEYCFDEFEVFK